MVKVKKISIAEYLLPVMIINLKSKTIISIPTQIGCIIDCSFCISKEKKFIRSLTSNEMISLYKESLKYSNNNNVLLSFTGEGEPFLNIKKINEVIKKTENDNTIEGYRICTSGIVPNQLSKIYYSIKPINLQISLHSPFTEKRKTIIEKTKPVEKILSEVKKNEHLFKEIAFNYVLIEDFNDNIEDLEKLKEIIDKKWVIKLNPLLSESGKIQKIKNKELFYNDLKMNGFEVKSFTKIGSEISNKFYDQLTYEYNNAILIN